ncbi:hypothetical protein HOR55_gp06 [Ralstonia phage RS-PII-1]|uniref:Uncharacterized protein n=1 Tax=Ralstonia phage RS-PII-1 TaxID=1932892 RepID=A0A1L7DQH3_9CAUD|nr:hypothetical protein HOR55_gp06 [Ralstonia phage RS-PII-1]APU00293.1 hypothetical protein [Ralstonia phage RS-PII-1]
MRFEDMPAIPLDTVNLADLRETVRAAVTQCELAPSPSADSAARTTALKAFFDGIGTKLAALATAQTPA